MLTLKLTTLVKGAPDKLDNNGFCAEKNLKIVYFHTKWDIFKTQDN